MNSVLQITVTLQIRINKENTTKRIIRKKMRSASFTFRETKTTTISETDTSVIYQLWSQWGTHSVQYANISTEEVHNVNIVNYLHNEFN